MRPPLTVIEESKFRGTCCHGAVKDLETAVARDSEMDLPEDLKFPKIDDEFRRLGADRSSLSAPGKLSPRKPPESSKACPRRVNLKSS
jgi:hypothetical protein